MASVTTIDRNDPITVTAGAAISEGQLLTLNGYTASVAGLTSQADAIAIQDIASGEVGPARLLAYGETYVCKADANGHSANATLYGAASGVASDTQGTGAFRVGVAVTAAGADELFELRYKPGFTAGA